MNKRGILGRKAALEDTACRDYTLLAYCRHARLHVCGCWALDLLLNQS